MNLKFNVFYNLIKGVDIDIQQSNQENFYFTQCEKVFTDVGNFGFVHYLGSKH